MATHNSAVMVGYLLQHPRIQNEGRTGEEKAFLYLRTARRDADDVSPDRFEDILVLYDGTGPLMERIKKLQQFDIILLKGVFNIVTADKPHRCPHCGQINFKRYGSYPFIYPIHMTKLDNVKNSFEYNEDLPDAILTNHFKEISNFMLIIGTVCSDPEMIGTEKHPICRYKLGVNRKLYIKTQPEIISDYPWVYSFGEQAQGDMVHLTKGSIVAVDGYFHTRNEQVPAKCEACGAEYRYPDIVMDFIPYSVEYLKYRSDEDIAKEKERERRQPSL